MRRRRWLIGGALLLVLSLFVCAAAILFGLDRHAPDAVLADLASMTPLGSTVAEVEGALRERGWHEGMCWVEDADGRKSRIEARCADCYRLGLPPPRVVIQAQWHFGEDGKLRDIALDYFEAGFIGFSKQNEVPILLSDRKR
jgi:hypothetical protein